MNVPDRTAATRQRAILIATWLVFAASWIKPIWPVEQALHSSLTVLGLITLEWLVRRGYLSTSALCQIAAFIMIHCLASRWLYSNVPYDRWLQDLFGFSLSESLGWTRNHFDRLVHIAYGLLLTPGLIELTLRRYPIVRRQAFVIALAIIMVSSLVYEWLEWLIAVLMSPEAAEAYNGQQGDVWDAHKDMLLATLATLVWWPWRRDPDR